MDSGLVRRIHRCPRGGCRRKMFIIRQQKILERYRFRCPKCRASKSIRKGSFFEQSRLTVPQLLFVTFCWAAKLPAKSASVMTNVCGNSVCRWYRHLREKCGSALLRFGDCPFGGPDTVVQIDEKVVAKKRKHAGEPTYDDQWIFGLYDTAMKRGHLQLISDRSEDTLIPILQKYVKPGSTVFSDPFPSYGHLQDCGYRHFVVNHSGFVDSTTGTCNNAIDKYWLRAKRNIRYHWLSRRDQLPLRINEFLWRDTLPSQSYVEVFHEMLSLLAIN